MQPVEKTTAEVEAEMEAEAEAEAQAEAEAESFRALPPGGSLSNAAMQLEQHLTGGELSEEAFGEAPLRSLLYPSPY